MRCVSLLLVCLASGWDALTPVDAAEAGAVIEGRVKLPTPPAERIVPERYQLKAGAIRPSPPTVAVLYLEGKFPATAPAEAKSVTLSQRGFQFSARVLPIRTGTRVEFPNFDDEYHNVFSYSKARRFDLGRYRKDETPAALVFNSPGVVRLYCEIHEHMRSVILVLDTPHFTATDTEGNFRLAGLPAGEFTLKAWLQEDKVLERLVVLRDGETLRAEF